jgi:hypothetical protein
LTRPAGVRPPPRYYVKKKTFSRRSRKPPNPCPTHTQSHRSPCENDCGRGRALDLCFGVGQTRGFFNHSLKIRSHGESNLRSEEYYSYHLPTLEALSLNLTSTTGIRHQSNHAFLLLLGRYLVQTVAGRQFPSQTLSQLLVSRRHTGRQPFVSIQIKCSKEVLQSDRNTFVRRCLIFLRCVLWSSCFIN